MAAKNRLKLGYGNAGCPSLYTVDGITDTLRGWAFRIGCSYGTLYLRICRYGMSPEEAIRAGKKPRRRKYLTANGETHTLAEWGRKTGIDPDRISRRIKNLGWSVEEALELQSHKNQLYRSITYRGKTRNIAQWARELGITDEAMRARLRSLKAGKLSKRCAFAKGSLDPKRKIGKVKNQNWYKGKRLKIAEIAQRKGCGKTQIMRWFREGYTATQILDNPALSVCHDRHELKRRTDETRRRNARIRELKQLGLIV